MIGLAIFLGGEMDSRTMEIFLIAGACGGLLKDLISTGGLVLPRTEKKADGTCIIRLGFLTGLIIGAAIGVLVDHYWVTAMCAAYGGQDVLERLINVKIGHANILAAKAARQSGEDQCQP